MRSMTQPMIHYRGQSVKRCMHHDRFQLEVIHMHNGYVHLSCTARPGSQLRSWQNAFYDGDILGLHQKLRNM